MARLQIPEGDAVEEATELPQVVEALITSEATSVEELMEAIVDPRKRELRAESTDVHPERKSIDQDRGFALAIGFGVLEGYPVLHHLLQSGCLSTSPAI